MAFPEGDDQINQQFEAFRATLDPILNDAIEKNTPDAPALRYFVRLAFALQLTDDAISKQEAQLGHAIEDQLTAIREAAASLDTPMGKVDNMREELRPQAEHHKNIKDYLDQIQTACKNQVDYFLKMATAYAHNGLMEGLELTPEAIQFLLGAEQKSAEERTLLPYGEAISYLFTAAMEQPLEDVQPKHTDEVTKKPHRAREQKGYWPSIGLDANEAQKTRNSLEQLFDVAPELFEKHTLPNGRIDFMDLIAQLKEVNDDELLAHLKEQFQGLRQHVSLARILNLLDFERNRMEGDVMGDLGWIIPHARKISADQATTLFPQIARKQEHATGGTIPIFSQWDEIVEDIRYAKEYIAAMNGLLRAMIEQDLPMFEIYPEYAKQAKSNPELAAVNILPDLTAENLFDASLETENLARILALTYKTMLPSEIIPSHLLFIPLAQEIQANETINPSDLVTKVIGDFLATIQWYDEEEEAVETDQIIYELTPPKKFPKTDPEIEQFIRWAQADITTRISLRNLPPIPRPLYINDAVMVQLWPGAAKEHMLETITERRTWLYHDENGKRMLDEFQVICIFAFKQYRDAVDDRVLFGNFKKVFDRINP